MSAWDPENPGYLTPEILRKALAEMGADLSKPSYPSAMKYYLADTWSKTDDRGYRTGIWLPNLAGFPN